MSSGGDEAIGSQGVSRALRDVAVHMAGLAINMPRGMSRELVGRSGRR